MLRNKYHVSPPGPRTRRTWWGTHTFDSKREAEWYDELEDQRLLGEVTIFIPQPSFILPGGVRYRADFHVYYADGRVEYIDVKGHETESFRAKKRLVEDIYGPITIKVVK